MSMVSICVTLQSRTICVTLLSRCRDPDPGQMQGHALATLLNLALATLLNLAVTEIRSLATVSAGICLARLRSWAVQGGYHVP